MIYFFISISAFVLSLLGLKTFLAWSRKRGILDIPNERSSHSVPVPRGAGLVLVPIILLGFVAANILAATEMGWSFLVGGLLIGILSWIDDLRDLNPGIRLLGHFIAAGLVTFEYLPEFSSHTINLIAFVVSIVWIVWMTNAFNFMDGIDGILGQQALIAGIGWTVIGLLLGSGVVAVLAITITASISAFLVFNWPPAKLFMGDVGSAFLGFAFASIPLIAIHETNSQTFSLAIVSLAMVWPFFFDTAFTFVRRLSKREKVWKAHREHIYQRLVIAGRSHSFVSVAYAVMTFLIGVSGILYLVFGGNYLPLLVFSIIVPTILLLLASYRARV